MSIKKKIKTFIEESGDEECLDLFTNFLSRVTLMAEFVKTDDVITHQVLTGMCGDYVFRSKPYALQWPMIPVKTEEIVGKENVN